MADDSSKTTFIYALVDPDTDEVRYVGKADRPQRRLAKHISLARSNKERNHKAHWIRKLLQGNKAPLLTILQEVPSYNWQQFEQSWIRNLRKKGEPITNLTSGGEGTVNYKHSVRTKTTISKKAKRQWAAMSATQKRQFCKRRRRARRGVGHKGSTSRFVGVSLHRQTGRWEAYLRDAGRKLHLGRYEAEIDAARAYDAAAVRRWGQNARLNFPPGMEKAA